MSDSQKSQPEDLEKFNLSQLAKDFSINVIDIAATDDEENNSALRKLLIDGDKIADERYENPDNGKYLKRVRNILIVGSGASKNAHQSIYTAWELLDLIKREDGNILSERFINKFSGFDSTASQNDFEQFFKELTDHLKDDYFIREEFKSLLGYKYVTSLFYEIIGHMFKHRLIDVIINYNFDEILDNIIEDEMGGSEYYKILFNGHCPDEYEDLLIDDKLAIPVYIKPHGTINHIGSLRFTEKQYAEGNQGNMKELLINLIKRDYANENAAELPINIISTGYSFNDSDLKDIIIEAGQKSKKQITYYVFDLATKNEYIKKSKYIQTIINTTNSGDQDRFRYFQMARDSDKWDLGHAFKDLWRETKSKFKSEFRADLPKGIQRHELIAALFHFPKATLPVRMPTNVKGIPSDSKHREELRKYLEKRILIELAIVIGKSDGILHINQINGSRVKKYLTYYLEKFKEQGQFQSLNDFLKVFKKGIGYYLDVFKDTFVLKERYFHDHKIDYDKILSDVLKRGFTKSVEQTNLKSLFRQVCENKLCHVNPDIKEYYVSEFAGLTRKNLLYSDLRWHYKLLKTFETLEEWNVLLCISETGEIFGDQYYIEKLKEKNAVVWMVTADYRLDRSPKTRTNLKYNIPQEITFREKQLPFELHNKHMYVFLKFDHNADSQPEYVAGIYYTRRLLSNVVNPVYFESDDDENIKNLFNVFSNYWKRASMYQGADQNSDLKVTSEMFIKNRNELFSMIKSDLT